MVWSIGGEDGDETQRLGDTDVEKFAGEVVEALSPFTAGHNFLEGRHEVLETGQGQVKG